MLETVIPDSTSIYKKVRDIINSTTASGRIRIGLTSNDSMKIVCENEADNMKIRGILKENNIKIEGIVPEQPPVPIPQTTRQHSFKPKPKGKSR